MKGRADSLLDNSRPSRHFYSVSKPLLVNFSVTVLRDCTALSGVPAGISASIFRVTRTDDPTYALAVHPSNRSHR